MSPATPKKPLVPYARQSHKKEHSISIGDQIAAIEKWAKANGFKITKPIVEEGVSGNKPWRGRELGRAVKACEDGEASGIIVAYQDRLSRENGLATAEVWEALQQADARLVCAAEGTNYRPSEDHDGEMLYAIKAAIARREWQRHRQNWSNARRNAIVRGVKTGPVPAGYDRGPDGVLVPNSDADAVREAFRLRAESGANWHDIARFLTAQGVTTHRGGSNWTASSAQRLIGCRVYLGEIKSGEFVNAAAHDPLVDEITFRRAGRKTPNDSYVRGDGPLLGGGLCRCGTCGSALVKGESKGWTHLRCSGGPKCKRMVTIGLGLIEPYLIEQTFARLGTLASPALDDSSKVAEAEARLRVIEDEYAATDADEASGELSPREAGKVRTALEREKDALEALIADRTTTSGEWTTMSPEVVRDMLFENVAGQDVLGDDLPAQRVPRDVPTARRFLKDVLGTVTVKPGRGAVEERVTISGGPLGAEAMAA